jgi:chromosome segregation ATPase
MAAEMSRAAASFVDLRSLHESSSYSSGLLQQQVMVLTADLSAQETKVGSLSQHVVELMRVNHELRSKVAASSAQKENASAERDAQVMEEVSRLSSEQRQAAFKVDALSQQLGESLRMNADLRAQVAHLQDESQRGAAERAALSHDQGQSLVLGMKQQESRIAMLGQQLSEVSQAKSELVGQISRIGAELQRVSLDRAATQATLERLSRQFHEGTSALAEENRRAAEDALASSRQEGRLQQLLLLQELSALNREVDAYRQEAQAAGASLHSAVERMNARLQAEEAQMSGIRAEAQEAASAEVAVVASLRGQVVELQGLLAGMSHQLSLEQGMRKADAQTFGSDLRSVEAQLQAAQDAAVSRTVALIESKTQGFIRAIKDLDVSGGCPGRAGAGLCTRGRREVREARGGGGGRST